MRTKQTSEATIPTQSPLRIGLAGLGLMGAALAERLIDAGHAVAGFDPDNERQAAFGRRGGRATTLAGLTRQSDVLIVAVYDGAQVDSIFDMLARAATSERRPVMICTTTCEPACIDRLAARAGPAGIGFLEAPISGTSQDVRTGEASLLVAGDPGLIATMKPLLIALSPHIMVVGRAGDASRVKLAINLVLQSNRAALAEGLVFAETIGLDASLFLQAARASAAYSRVMDSKGEKMRQRDFRPQSRIAQTLKDAELIMREAQSHGLALPMTSTQTELLHRAIALHGGDCDSAAVITAIGPQATPEGTAP